MNRKSEHLIYRWLDCMKIPVSKTFLTQLLLSHPDYPSLASITDTLDELNIENGAFVVEKEKLNGIPVPFLAHTAASGGSFELITDTKKHMKLNPDFVKRWDGIAVVAEKPEQIDNAENELLLQQEKRNSRVLWFFIFFISGLSFFSITNNFSWQYAGLLLTTMAAYQLPY